MGGVGAGLAVGMMHYLLVLILPLYPHPVEVVFITRVLVHQDHVLQSALRGPRHRNRFWNRFLQAAAAGQVLQLLWFGPRRVAGLSSTHPPAVSLDERHKGRPPSLKITQIFYGGWAKM